MSTPQDIQKARDEMLNKLKETELYKKVEADQETKNPLGGRPIAVDTTVLQKLYEAFIIGATDQEACFWANIANGTLYNFQTKYPEFLDLKEQWKENPVMKARNTIYKNLNSPMTASWFLERKRKSEFSTRSELTGADGEKLLPEVIDNLNRYDNLAGRIETLISGQSVETNSSIQNKGQAGESGDVPTEPNTNPTS